MRCESLPHKIKNDLKDKSATARKINTAKYFKRQKATEKRIKQENTERNITRQSKRKKVSMR